MRRLRVGRWAGLAVAAVLLGAASSEAVTFGGQQCSGCMDYVDRVGAAQRVHHVDEVDFTKVCEDVWWVKMLRQEALDQIRGIVREECQPTLVCEPTLVCDPTVSCPPGGEGGGDLACLDDQDAAIASLRAQCEVDLDEDGEPDRKLIVRLERTGGFKIACRRVGAGNRHGDAFPCRLEDAAATAP